MRSAAGPLGGPSGSHAPTATRMHPVPSSSNAAPSAARRPPVRLPPVLALPRTSTTDGLDGLLRNHPGALPPAAVAAVAATCRQLSRLRNNGSVSLSPG
eukprot:352098-Chlamydomonas_euryale.AAC.1